MVGMVELCCDIYCCYGRLQGICEGRNMEGGGLSIEGCARTNIVEMQGLFASRSIAAVLIGHQGWVRGLSVLISEGSRVVGWWETWAGGKHGQGSGDSFHLG